MIGVNHGALTKPARCICGNRSPEHLPVARTASADQGGVQRAPIPSLTPRRLAAHTSSGTTSKGVKKVVADDRGIC